ncbi:MULTISPECIES: staphylopine family metallophore export MFS transporter CntE [Staphylococcus]|uniref:staphylopine family metallophore export MFS transporter CntE n=1 Tax=Staphylococcus TaxID=1279 RepID=UPI0002463C1D|nr:MULTISPECIES: MFS transporter [Staphylococcus]MCR4454724.1 MFS transporter [Aeromonas salmonicida]QAV30747.1 MFS transporter [Sulfitobacter donghicola]AGZ25600.1 MFS family major facilitator transporter [Staphylococcus pasteuri SP1]KAB7644756.1 MFS transporter [Staphylococcus sp. B2-b]MBN6853277.1 MFS transporter [Staphylococcus warneri]
MKGAMAWPFLRLYILTLMFFSANAILNVFIPLRGHDLGATNTTIGIVMGAYMLTAMVFRPWAGQIIARVGPIKVLRIILLINACALILYGLTGLEGYFIARVMQGVCTAFFSMSLQLGIIDALPEEHRSEGVSLYSLFSTIPNLAGPLIAVGIWHLDRISIFAIVMIAIALTTTFFGYRVTFANEEPDTRKKVEPLPFNAVTVFAQFFKNKELFNSGLIMIVVSIVFGAVSTFVPLYTVKFGFADAGIFLTIQAIAVVLARIYLRKYIPSDGMWHPVYMVSVLMLLVIASMLVAIGPHIHVMMFYSSAILIGATQALVYPTLTSYLSFVLPKAGRNMLLGLFIACADLGVSLGGSLMGPISDLVGFSWMYTICGMLVVVMILMSTLKGVRQK